MDGLLRGGAWAAAEEASGALVAELISDLKGGPAGAEILATAYAQRAVAEAGLERREEALWSLAIAGCLDPAFAAAPLDAFGTAGARLEAWRRGEPDLRAAAPAPGTAGFVAPAIHESPTIVFRASAEVLQSFDMTLAVELVIDAEGRPRAPVVSGSRDNPSPIAASLEALRGWRFDPARLGGQPVPVLLTLDLPLTRGVATRARKQLTALRGTPDA